MPKTLYSKSRSQGFSLLEVLITILLITVGVLGMVAMQGRAIQYTNDSMHRTQAAILANELIEIVRATPTSATTDASFYVTETDGGLPSSAGNCRYIDDTALMEEQLACWGNKVRRLLPDSGAADIVGQFYACRSRIPGACGDGAAIEVQLAWRAAGGQCLNDEDVDSDICIYRVRTQI